MPDYTRKKLALTTSAQTAYTVPAEKTAIVHGIHVANIDGVNSVNVDVWIVDIDDAALAYLCKTSAVAAGDALEIAGPVYLKAGDLLRALASAASDAVMWASIEEIAVPV